MAVISSFYEIRDRDGKVHPTTTECGYLKFANGRRGPMVQLETGGSAIRQYPGKVSQTLQLDESSARELVGILIRAFPGIRP